MMRFLISLLALTSGCQMYSNYGDSPQKFDREGIRRTFHNRQNDIRRCYEKELEKTPELKGILKISFDILDGGIIKKVTYLKDKSSLKSDSLFSCIEKMTLASKFPHPQSGQVMNVVFPFAFNHKAKVKK